MCGVVVGPQKYKHMISALGGGKTYGQVRLAIWRAAIRGRFWERRKIMENKMEYVRKHPYLVCLDSDGCVIDGMTIKHLQCFGPCAVAEWGLEAHKEELLRYWNEVNLYRMSRGINRFKGLALLLQYAKEKGYIDDGLECYREWVDSSPELSEAALEREIARVSVEAAGREFARMDAGASGQEPARTDARTLGQEPARTGDKVLKKALSWSRAVNRAVAAIPGEKKPTFEGVRKALEKAHAHADVAVISAANAAAVEEEWRCNGLLEYVDICMTQEYGSKAECIGKLLQCGYEPGQVVMLGDAPGDHAAADKNGVLFFPVLAGKETKSWEEFCGRVFDLFVQGKYDGEMQKGYLEEFEGNLS